MSNQYQPQFATGAGANTLTNAQWQQLTSLIQNGFQSGVASSSQMNTILRICAMSSAALGYLIDQIGLSADDNGNVADFASKLLTVFKPPVGAVLPYAGYADVTPPTSYLNCDGASLNTTAYSKLFAVIGYQYGGSGGSFNLPDMRSRFPVGYGAGFLLGTMGGSANAVVVQHFHGVSDSGHRHVVTDPGHSHGPGGTATQFTTETETTGPGIQLAASGNALLSRPTTASATTSLSINTAMTGIGVNNAGVSGNNANLPPYLSLSFIIRYQ